MRENTDQRRADHHQPILACIMQPVDPDVALVFFAEKNRQVSDKRIPYKKVKHHNGGKRYRQIEIKGTGKAVPMLLVQPHLYKVLKVGGHASDNKSRRTSIFWRKPEQR